MGVNPWVKKLFMSYLADYSITVYIQCNSAVYFVYLQDLTRDIGTAMDCQMC